MDFDPLSFFTPQEEIIENSQENLIQFKESNEFNEEKLTINDEIEEENDTDGFIHILDLPLLNKKLPRNVILVILELLQLDQETNFGGKRVNNDEIIDKSTYLNSKKIEFQLFDEVESWLLNNGYIKLSNNLLNLQFTQEIFNYLNKILSSSYFQTDDEILKLTSLRISENSGRTARPNFQRKIVIKGLEKPILLNEPSLTSDSLGLKTWGSSLILSEYIVNNKDLLKGQILELGSGTGLVGITIGVLGFHVVLTDLPEILPNLTKNKDINKINADCEVLDWTKPEDYINEFGDVKYDTIVIADPIYSSNHPYWVVNMMKQFLKKDKNSRILLQLPIRKNYEQERKLLWELIDNNGFKVVNEVISDGFDDFGEQKFIYKEIRWNDLDL